MRSSVSPWWSADQSKQRIYNVLFTCMSALIEIRPRANKLIFKVCVCVCVCVCACVLACVRARVCVCVCVCVCV